MFRLFTLICLALGLSLPSQAQTTTIQTARGEATVPLNPAKVAVFDWAALDTLNQLGVKVEATTATVQVGYLKPLFAQAKTVGTLFEPDYEALNRYQPQLVVVGGPSAAAFDTLSTQFPTIDMSIDNEQIRLSAKQRLHAFGQLFHQQARAKQLAEQIDQAFMAARTAAQGKGNGLVISITGAKVAAFGTNARLSSWIHHDLGVPAADPHLTNAGHGKPISFEYLQQINPDWLFVLDRTSALGERGLSAHDVLDNALVQQTTAWRKGQVVYMPNANYIAAGGVQQLLQASKQLQIAFEAAK